MKPRVSTVVDLDYRRKGCSSPGRGAHVSSNRGFPTGKGKGKVKRKSNGKATDVVQTNRHFGQSLDISVSSFTHSKCC